jgi:hypothetical protein
MATYKFSIDGEIQTFQEYDAQTMEDFKQELSQYMANKLDEFRSEKVSASGKIASLGLTRE